MSDYKTIGTYIEREMYESQAFLSLTGIAPQLLILFLGKRFIKFRKVKKREIKECTNCDNIIFTYVEAKEQYGITKARFTKARDQFLTKGFMRIKKQAGACEKDKNVYAVSENWRLWRPGIIFEKREKVTIQKGFLNNPVTAAKSRVTRALKRTQRK